MASENNPPDVEASNWTLATGTQPGKRDVYTRTQPGDIPHPLVRAATTRHLRTAVVVVGRSDRSPVVDALFGATAWDVVFVESTARAYSQIRRVLPDVVIVCCEFDDPSAFQVLSMLKADNRTSRIPVIASMTASQVSPSESELVKHERATSCQALATLIN